ncbi:MAG: metal-dependent phosphohydrolase [Spirulinaceae cyanobacterium SM2_1_0]|nr:metal-dependent phosphohydrolase [Spirulinaceae cyanobacterium SM2_1_0]
MLEGSLLQKLVAARRSVQRPLNFGTYYKNTLVALCHALEDFVLETDSQPLLVSAFQQGRWYAQEAERYAAIADCAAQVAVMATRDSGFADLPQTAHRANVSLVSIAPDDPLAREWHLIILSPTYAAMVLCQELMPADYGPAGEPDNDLERKFYGFWTFEPMLVKVAIELAIAHIGQYDPKLQQQLTTRVAMMQTESDHCQRDDLNTVVMKVVSYLQATHQTTEALTAAQALDDNLASNELQAFLRMAQLIDQADARNPLAAAEVAALAEVMGQLLDLPAWQLKRLRLAGLLHRLAPLQGTTITSDLKAQAQRQILAQQGLLPKTSVMRAMPRLQAITNIITHQSECWDGSGQPEGLSYDAIPLESRILALLAYFQQAIAEHKQAGNDAPFATALAVCQAKAGSAFDPKLVEALALLVMGLQQGMSLPTDQPKIAAGIWLLDEPEAVFAAARG